MWYYTKSLFEYRRVEDFVYSWEGLRCYGAVLWREEQSAMQKGPKESYGIGPFVQQGVVVRLVSETTALLP